LLAKNLSDAIDKSLGNFVNSCNVLHISTLLDPRFAYDESIWARGFWTLIEEDLKSFALAKGRLY
jgi:hypothetical protein